MTDVAYGQDSIPFRDVAGAEFRFGKVVTLPFFGSGVVEIPPGGYKHEKNARAMHLCFFVHKGKVDVSVAGTRFSIAPGGTFQVPRGRLFCSSLPRPLCHLDLPSTVKRSTQGCWRSFVQLYARPTN
jgi:hypothetical protein